MGDDDFTVRDYEARQTEFMYSDDRYNRMDEKNKRFAGRDSVQINKSLGSSSSPTERFSDKVPKTSNPNTITGDD